MSSESPFKTPRAPDGASCSVPPTTPSHLYQLTGPQMEAYRTPLLNIATPNNIHPTMTSESHANGNNIDGMDQYSEENISRDCPVTTSTQLKHRGDSQTMACGLSTTTLEPARTWSTTLEPLILQRQSSSATSNTCSATTPVTPLSVLSSSDPLFSSSGFSSGGSSKKRQVNYAHILPSPGVPSGYAYLSFPGDASSTSDMV